MTLLKLVGALWAVVAVAAAGPADCGECEVRECVGVRECVAGTTLDECDCCTICAQRLGQDCKKGASVGSFACGKNLVCGGLDKSGNGVCECEKEDFVCGSDGETYNSICHLVEASASLNLMNESMRIDLEGNEPCKHAPVIRTAPQDANRPLGGILVLDCEAVGYPVPTLRWELNMPNGDFIKLPSDDSRIAVQVRGGPERLMVTGWVQIMQVAPENTGAYTCIASNALGEAEATAKITYYTPENEDETNLNEI